MFLAISLPGVVRPKMNGLSREISSTRPHLTDCKPEMVGEMVRCTSFFCLLPTRQGSPVKIGADESVGVPSLFTFSLYGHWFPSSRNEWWRLYTSFCPPVTLPCPGSFRVTCLWDGTIYRTLLTRLVGGEGEFPSCDLSTPFFPSVYSFTEEDLTTIVLMC